MACDRWTAAYAVRTEEAMGDKSPKSKQRGQKQKNAARAQGVADAKSKQAGQSRAPLSAKDRK
jgi:hypothetical protein